MANEDIKAKMAELRGHQRTIQAASAAQADGWRHAVVAGRREVSTTLGGLSALIAARIGVDGMDMVRRAVSTLRAALAEHQALWPAVSIDTANPAYVTSVARVRGAYANLDAVLADLDRPSRSNA